LKINSYPGAIYQIITLLQTKYNEKYPIDLTQFEKVIESTYANGKNIKTASRIFNEMQNSLLKNKFSLLFKLTTKFL